VEQSAADILLLLSPPFKPHCLPHRNSFEDNDSNGLISQMVEMMSLDGKLGLYDALSCAPLDVFWQFFNYSNSGHQAKPATTFCCEKKSSFFCLKSLEEEMSKVARSSFIFTTRILLSGRTISNFSPVQNLVMTSEWNCQKLLEFFVSFLSWVTFDSKVPKMFQIFSLFFQSSSPDDEKINSFSP